MIRKVPNMKAWVLRRKDYRLLCNCTNSVLINTYALPLFDTNPPLEIPFLMDDDELILVVDFITNEHSLTLEQVEEINKTWNRFYE